MAKTTWRFEFVDINKSVTYTEEEATWTGFAVIRAPKGSTKAMYVPPHNKDMIQSMFGYASADWPDLFEVIDFNNEYGVYISAPTVDVAEYPNYYGGVYLTKQGVLPLYRVTDKKNPNFEVGMPIGKESAFLPGVDSSTFGLADLNEAGKQAVITITGVDSDVFKRLKYIDFEWGSTGTFRYKLDKTTGLLYPDASTLKVTDAISQNTVCGSFEFNKSTNKYDFIIGGTEKDQHTALSGTLQDGAMNTAEHETKYGIPFIDFNSSSFKKNSKFRYVNFMSTTGATTIEAFKSGNYAVNYNQILDAVINGGSVILPNGDKVVFDKAVKTAFNLVYDVTGDVYSYHVQPSPTANVTKITIDNIIYDKYKYTKSFLYVVGTMADLPLPAKDAKSFAKTLTDDGYIALLVEKDAATKVVKAVKICQYVETTDDVESTDDNGNTTVRTVTTGKWVDSTPEFEGDSILAFNPLIGAKDADVHHKIFKDLDESLTEMTLDSTEADYKLTENVMFNSYHCKAVEEDQGGELHTSGDKIGSLDEFGVDENNSDNYWEELIPPDESVVFAEVYVLKTFEDDLDENGVFTGYRVDSSVTGVHGQRYVDYVVQKNIAEGRTGCNVTDASLVIQKKFTKILKEGLIEAAKPKYADCSIFFECSGLDELKPYLPAIRTMHYTSTIITPKNINQSIFENLKKAKVVGRLRGSAQYCQELLYKDKNVRKKYYACPIGAVAVMLMRIMENYMGGVAPMWINEGNVGGQIDDCMQRSAVSARWDFEDLDTKIMDQNGLNPILMDIDDGVMITSHRTTEQNAGDWSYLGHSMSFDLCKREIRDKVMKPQIGKKINPHYISLRQDQVNRILQARTTGSNPIWSYANSDIDSANDDYTRAQKTFVIPVEVRVYPFSEIVRLSFTNLGQITTVSD